MSAEEGKSSLLRLPSGHIIQTFPSGSGVNLTLLDSVEQTGDHYVEKVVRQAAHGMKVSIDDIHQKLENGEEVVW